MKILFCTNSFKNITNGPAKFANYLVDINSLYPNHEVKILTEDIDQSSEHIIKLNVQVPFFLRPFSQLLRMYQYYEAAKKIRSTIFHYDVLVFNNAMIGLWAAMHFPKTIGMINDDNNACARLSEAFTSKRGLKQWVFRYLEKKSCRFHHIVITNSDYLTQQLSKEYPGNAQTFRKLYKSTAIPVHVKERRHTLSNEIRILFVKNDFRRGGLMVLIEAISKLSNRQKVTLVVAGPAEYNRAEISTAANSKKLNCSFIGPVSQERVFEEMLKADVFCVPAYQEALGVGNIEALFRNLPVVTTNVGGIPEVLNNGENGWMVEPGNSTELAKALEECMSNATLRNDKVSKGLEFVKRFEKNYMLRSFLAILEESNASMPH